MRVKALIYFLLFSISVFSKTVDIGLLTQHKMSSFVVTVVSGTYKLVAKGKRVAVLGQKDVLYFNLNRGRIQVKSKKGVLGYFKYIDIKGIGKNNIFRITSNKPKLPAHEYEGHLKIKYRKGRISLVNRVNIEKYIQGVVESEGGSKAPKAYYKTQAILCRTYLLVNLRKHQQDGYNLCDEVHCQAYKNRVRYSDLIKEACKETDGLVIVDADLHLITAAFYSNSGGLTSPAEWVWQQPRSYLTMMVDTFSVEGNNFEWEKKIPYSKWLQFLKKNGFKINRMVSGKDFIDTDFRRQKYYKFGSDSLLLTNMRKAFKLRSTYFSINYSQGDIVLSGRGYGHGVGLAQEGAMKMAEEGYTYKDIINFYYKNVYIVSMSALTIR